MMYLIPRLHPDLQLGWMRYREGGANVEIMLRILLFAY